MSPERFTDWLNGWIEDKQILTEADVKKLKEKMGTIYFPPKVMDRLTVPSTQFPFFTPTITCEVNRTQNV